MISFPIFISSCASNSGIKNAGSRGQPSVDEISSLDLPLLESIDLSGRKLKVVATTSIIGDLVSKVGDEVVDLVILMDAGQDPHRYEPTAEKLRQVAEADVIFVNGWGLEEGLIDDIATVSTAPTVPVAANIKPRIASVQETEHGSRDASDDLHEYLVDPHVWLDPKLSVVMLENITRTFQILDPSNGSVYDKFAGEYRQHLDELLGDYDQLSRIPPEKRKLVTNHDSLGYFADAYDFEIIGTIIPSASTLAEPTAKELASLVAAMEEADVCIIFGETTQNNVLAEAVANELENCESVTIVTLYTGSLGPSGSEAATYLSMMESNLEAILNAFSQN